MTKGLIAIDLIFPDTVHFFGPRPNQQKYSTYPKRQKIRGKVRLVASRPIKLHRVEIRLKSHTYLNWRDPLKSQHAILAEKMNAWKTLRKCKSILLEDATLPAGVTELGFEVTVPGYLAPTFKSEFLEIQHVLSAKVLPSSKLAKEMNVEREINVLKTLVPKDVSYGQVVGYRVPRRTMRGERPGSLAWQFYVPRWVCLENEKGIEFEGILSPSSSTDIPIRVKKVQVDFLQEELYHNGSFGSSSNSKRHLVMSVNAPSTYLHPPLDTRITFSFPLQPHNSRYIKSTIPGFPNNPTSSIAKVVSANGENVTTLSQGDLTYSLESPFLHIRHYIRFIIHLSHHHQKPICIGLPIQITRRINVTHDLAAADALPSYQDITRDEEQLPDYMTSLQLEQERGRGEEEDLAEQHDRCCWVRGFVSSTSANSLPPETNNNNTRTNTRSRRAMSATAAVHPRDHSGHRPHCSFSTDLSALGIPIPPEVQPTPSRSLQLADDMTVEERTLDDFWIIS